MSKNLVQQPVNKVWARMGQNVALHSEDGKFYISYNANTGSILPMFAGDGSGEETVLCTLVKGEVQFYILNGDFRKEYEALIDKGFKACKDFFLAHPESKSSWSD